MLFYPRRLTLYETSESRKAFGNNLNYEKIRIFEDSKLPNYIDDLGRLIKKMPKRGEHVDNAITLGNWCLFGREIEPSKAVDMNWLIHELTHVWQFQTMGWVYIFKALDAQKKLGAQVYDFGGEEGLKKHIKNGSLFKDFNLEQQGDIMKTYYEKLCKGEDTKTWEVLIKQMDKSYTKR
ncbi:MAG: hypothetical protein ABFS03_03080 [Chloroflexota bacterium]